MACKNIYPDSLSYECETWIIRKNCIIMQVLSKKDLENGTEVLSDGSQI